MAANQTPEQLARDKIDSLLAAAGWRVQGKKALSWSIGPGIAVLEYPTDVGPADYVLFVDKKPVGVIEAKREDEGYKLLTAEEQSAGYASGKLKHLDNDPLPFVYESTGTITRFTDFRDPKPRSREVFSFHRPETLREWLDQGEPLRRRLTKLPEILTEGLRDCQISAITKLEASFRENRSRALIQMATGSGKTYTAITFIYRLLKFVDAKRVLFLVDTRNLGEQAEQEFMAYTPNDDNRKFTELYNVQRLASSYVASDSQVCISTIQRLYSILKGEELEDAAEEGNPAEHEWLPKEPQPVVYSERVPIEEFDFIVIDECHRSIYNLWKQVLEYFDAFLIGLTATPDMRTFAFFNENVVSEYGHDEAVADGVNVGYQIYLIETDITKKGGHLKAHEYVDKRERLSRKKRWEQLDEDVTYSSKQLDHDVVNPSQIRNVVRTFKEKLPELFPGRIETPKTLVFAKSDSHADDIIQIVREEFAEGNEFCKKLTYKSTEEPKSLLAQLRNEYNPRIAVTVDMIATGTDVKPLECLLFMRDVKSKNYFEQMKGRGTRTIDFDSLRKVTPSARSAKTHFVVVDAVGVTKSIKTDSHPLEKKPGIPLKDLLSAVLMGVDDEELYSSLAGRLARLEKQVTENERATFQAKANGKRINDVIKELLAAHDPDIIEARSEKLSREQFGLSKDEAIAAAHKELVDRVRSTFSGELNDYVDTVRRVHEQIIDSINVDKVTLAGWNVGTKEQARSVVADFAGYLEANRDEVAALRIFYGQPFRRREVTFKMVKELSEKLNAERPGLAPARVWEAYERLENVKGKSPKEELVSLVSLVRRSSGIDAKLTSFDGTVDRNFKNWIFKHHSGPGLKFTEEQMAWLRMIKEHIATSFHIESDDLDYTPFDAQGGRGRMWQLFGDETERLISELNEALVG